MNPGGKPISGLTGIIRDYGIIQAKPTAELIKIIKDLMYNSAGSSGNTKERDQIIKKVEQDFANCDARIDQYIRNSSKDLSNLIKVFNEIAKKIENSREKVSTSREALKQCKILLQSKRDDVRRLWLEWCEQKYYYENILKLKQLYHASENVRIYCSQKKYLEAAQLIADSSQLLEKEFHEITGLNEIKRQVDDERIKLEHYLYLELTDQLYTVVTKSVLETGNILPSREASFKRRFRHHNVSRNQDDVAQLNENLKLTQTNEATIEKIVQAAYKLNSPEGNINIIEKMINDVNKNITNQLILMINATSTHVLESNLIDNSKFNQSFRYSRQSVENNPKFLAQLIDLTFEQFKMSAKNYRQFIEHASKINACKYQSSIVWTCIQNVLIQLLEEYLDIRQLGSSYASNTVDLDKMDVNSFFVRKRLINLAFGDNTNQTAQSNAQAQSNPTTDGSNASNSMFAFKNSSHALSIIKYNREKNNENLFDEEKFSQDGGDDLVISKNFEQRTFKILVCQPDHRNITTIFSLMEHIIKEVADEVKNAPSNATLALEQQGLANIAAMMSSSLKNDLLLESFLKDFILRTFITNAVEAIKENASIHNSAIDGKFEIAKQLIPLSKQRELGLSKPILQNIYLVHQSCVDLFHLIKDMNSYASEFSRAMHSLIDKHIDYCNKIFLSIVTNSALSDAAPVVSTTNENYVYSMVWVSDEGIKQYFKQLPAFSTAIKGRPSPAVLLATKSANATNLASKNSMNSHSNMLNSHNPAVLAATVEMEQFNAEILSKEVDTLIANVNDKELEEIDIITNFNYIEMIAHLHESFDWLIVQLKFIVNSLEQMIKNPKSLNNSMSMSELNKLVAQLDELDKWRGDTLLLLYLETRVHCFYHLINFIRQENNTSYAGDLDTDPDDCVLNMNRDLHRIYEHLSRSLQESKVNYVFDALGFMIATIFIRAIKNFKKISKHGIAKMCRNIFHVEQNLSAIRTKSDPHLMKAHRFYELLYKKPEELVNHLLEHEAEFQLKDYVNLLNLIYRSKPGDEINSLADNIQALTNILKNKH